jgi:hypothetical protein
VKNNVRRPGLSAVAAVAVLGLLTGCGGSADATDSAGEGAKESATPVAKALSEAELEKLALEKGDVKGFTLEKASADEIEAPPEGSQVAPAACAPYEDLVMNSSPGEPATVVARHVNEKVDDSPGDLDGDGELSLEELQQFDEAMDDALDSATVTVGISSYEGDGAASAMEELRSWTGACTSGFAVGKQKQGVKDITENAPAEGTDEAVTFTMTVGVEGEQTPMAKYAVYRDGGTIVTFRVMNLAAMAGERTSDPKVVLDAQLAKLS